MSRVTMLLVTVILMSTVAPAQAAKDLAAKCAAAKQNAAAKKIVSKLRCRAKALAHGTTSDPACLTDAETKFSEAIAKAESKGGCAVTGNTAAIEGACDTCVANVTGLTPVSVPTTFTCFSSPYPQCGGTCPFGQVCQAFLYEDAQPCVGGNMDMSGGQPANPTCDTFCGCVNPASACNGQPCGRICSITSHCVSGSHQETTSVCCSGGDGPCDLASGTLPCCCAESCAQPVGSLGTCGQDLVCDASHQQTQCQ